MLSVFYSCELSLLLEGCEEYFNVATFTVLIIIVIICGDRFTVIVIQVIVGLIRHRDVH